MKINIVCVGKIKEKYFTDAIAEYKKRLLKFCDVKVLEVEESTKIENISQKIETESEMLLSKCQGVIISLDSGGKMLSSPEIAEFMKQKMVDGSSEFSFVIGGSNGISTKLKNSSNLTLSFGKITYPHQLFRVILFEQIYRAFSIINNLPYHK